MEGSGSYTHAVLSAKYMVEALQIREMSHLLGRVFSAPSAQRRGISMNSDRSTQWLKPCAHLTFFLCY